MASWLPFSLPSTIQKRFLSYALSRIGVFDESSLDLEKLNLTWGRQNVIELKDIALDAAAISKKANLPSSCHITSGKAATLKLMVPADIHRSGIVIDVLGVELALQYQQKEENSSEARDESKAQARSPVNHRAQRRTASFSARSAATSYRIPDEDESMPSVQDLARSFLMEEPLEERRKLEASVAAFTNTLEDSMTSDSSQGAVETGTGATLGVPAFLATFLNGVLDRIVVNIRDVRVSFEAQVAGVQSFAALSLQLSVANVKIWSDISSIDAQRPCSRHCTIGSITVAISDGLGTLSRESSESIVRHTASGSFNTRLAPSTSSTAAPSMLSPGASVVLKPSTSHPSSPVSDRTADTDRFADANDEQMAASTADSQYGIRPGDDNISWGSRQDDRLSGKQNLWESMADEEDLPDSLLFDEKHNTPLSNKMQHFCEHLPTTLSTSHSGTTSPRPTSSAAGSRQSSQMQSGPGSWPAIHKSVSEVSQQSDFHSTQSVPFKDPVVIQHTASAIEEYQSFDNNTDDPLGQSRIFSHDEAQSMYMSALSDGLQKSASSKSIEVPGAWGAESRPDAQDTTAETKSEIDTPRAQSPILERSAPVAGYQHSNRVKVLLMISDIALAFSPSAPPHSQHTRESRLPSVQGRREPERTLLSASRQASSLSGMSDTFEAPALDTVNERSTDKVDVQVSDLRFNVDIPTLELLLKSMQSLKLSAASDRQSASTPSSIAQQNDLQIGLSVNHVKVAMVDELETNGLSDHTVHAPCLVSLEFGKVSALHELSRKVVQFGDIVFSVLGRKVAWLADQERRPSKHEVLVVIYNDANSDVRQRTVPELSVDGQTLTLDLDLEALSPLTEHLLALSGIIELATSSHIPSRAPSPDSKRSATTVRFTDDAKRSEEAAQLKVNARIAGVALEIRGRSCGIVARSKSLKAVHRDQGFSLTTARVDISQVLPHSNHYDSSIAIDNIRLDFLNSPTDKDLDRFLALLTPSSDKYEDDSDILLETLIRQRKKGACLRIQMDNISAHITDLESLSKLTDLGGDLSQVSVVTKYLPEDDRPGVLSMIRAKAFDAHIPVNSALGALKITSQDLQCAHVGLPLLVAAALSDLSVKKLDGTPVVRQLIPYSGQDNLPMLMMRMVGDEVEPSIKLKLYNICAEYSVPVLLEVMGGGSTVSSEQVVKDMTNSIADLASSTTRLRQVNESQTSTTSRDLKLDLLVHSSAVGLSPTRMPSKALFVLTDALLSMTVPQGENIKTTLELRRAAMFITNDASSTHSAAARSSVNTSTEVRVATALSRAGYVSILSIRAAHIDVLVDKVTPESDATTEVDVEVELFLMESCADSTQTLFATLGALSPPGQPSKRPAYLLEPVTLEDMISSFSGEPVLAPKRSVDTLFDADDSPIDPELGMLDDLASEDLLIESEMTSSLYGPISGVLDITEPDEDDRPPAEAAESLLEEDPFVMTVNPDELPFSDTTLLKDLRSQLPSGLSDDTIELPLMEYEDLAYDALASEPSVLGNANRLNPPALRHNTPALPTQQCPLIVRLREVHVLWNLHDGYDWQKTRDGITTAVEQVEQRHEARLARRRQSRNAPEDDESVIGDFLFNSIYIGVPSTQEAQDIRRQINRHIDDLASETESVPYSGISRPTTYSTSERIRPRRRLKLERSTTQKISFELTGLSADFHLHPSDSADVQSSVDVRVRHFEIFDNVPTSTWKKFLTQLYPEGEREMCKPMVHLQLLNVRTIQDYAATEMIVKVTLLPLRLHVDQDALDFITRFFEFKDETKDANAEPTDQPFLQRVEVETVDLQLDYKPKKVDYAGIRSGRTTEFMNFVILEATNIRLKHAIVYGIKGFEPLHKTLNDVWMPDVRRNQLPTVLAGLAPVRSLVNIGTSMRDVVAIPVREYQKDGRIVRSIQKGAMHFGKTTASEIARFGAKVAIGTQNILAGAEELLSPSAASPSGRASSHRVSSDYGWHEVEEEDGDREKRAISAYADQPLSVLAGLQSARRYLEHDLLTAKDALIAVQGEVVNSSGPGAVAAAVARHAPTVILRPVIGASRAVGTALLGVGNQIDRDNLRRMEDKYKRR